MSDTIKIHVLHCGQVQVDIAVPFHQKSLNPFAYTGFLRSGKYKVTLPVSAYLVEHPNGLLLIDTGWHTDVRSDQMRYLGWLHHRINTALLPEGQAIHEQLEKRGIAPTDLDYVLLSHLDTDHVSGLHLVRDANNIMTSNEEWHAAQKDKIRYLHHMWDGVNIRTFSMTPSPYGPMKRSFDLFGDNSVLFVHVPGHTPGLTATLIQRKGKFVLLTSDCGYAKRSWEQMILPGICVNKRQSEESLAWVKSMTQKPECRVCLANHDPDVQQQVIGL